MTPTGADRSTFASRFGIAMTLIGVAVGLGDVWRFPYLVGKFGGAAFVLLYVVAVVVVGVPGLAAELALGRSTRRGPVGAYAAGGMPAGRAIGWGLFVVVMAATAYYAAVIGWVGWYALASLLSTFGVVIDPATSLPPEQGFSLPSLLRQLVGTTLVIGSGGWVMYRGLREGIERSSRWIMPALFVILLILVVRALTLPGAEAGVRWYILDFSPSDITPPVVLAALGQAVFSTSLGGTFMVVYGSYLPDDASPGSLALTTAVGDTLAGLLAGLAIIPAVIALGLEPGSGPGLLFGTLPQVFARIPFGNWFGLIFYLGLAGAAWLSAIAALEVLVAGLTDNTRMTRGRAIALMSVATIVLSIPPSINLRIFVPWDLTFGSGMQTLGALFAALTFGWCLHRGEALRQLRDEGKLAPWLFWWIRVGVPAAILAVGLWWLATSVLGIASDV
ncbi:MAG: sodium-dependent transporter [Gemmatimonadetes bacterium]|nr:sodium-dependent transporter [Gemmatimonadota bacterium]